MIRHCWQSVAAWLVLLPISAGQFNGTFSVTVTALDPMAQFDSYENQAWQWDLEPSSGFRSQDSPGYFSCRFVATGYQAGGTAENPIEPGGEVANNTVKFQNQPDALSEDSNAVRKLDVGGRNGTYLGAMSGLELAAYELVVRHAHNVRVRFHNLSLELPIRSQA